MFTKIAVVAVSALAAVTGVASTPLAIKPNDLAARSFFSFNNWGGLSSLANFDDFYGVENFDGTRHEQVIVAPQTQLVCHTQAVEIIQQRLLVIQETAKRIITEQICDVETQTIVFEQWHAGLSGFGRDLRRVSGHQVGFDRDIASHFNQIVNADNSISTHHLGFSGHDFGRNTVLVGGHNWDDSHSFVSVGSAYRCSRDAFNALH